WDTDPLNTAWTTGSAAVAFATNDNVTFATSGTIAAAAGVAAGSVTVAPGADLLRIEGAGFAGTTLTKSGSGTLVLAAANTLSGGVTVTGGAVVPAAVGAFGSQALGLNGGTLAFADPAVTTMSNAYSSGTAGGMIDVPDGTASISGVGTALGTQAGPGIPRGDSRTFNTLVKVGSGTLALTANLGAQMSYDTAAGNVTTAGGINLQIQRGTMEISGGRTWNLATGTTVTTGSTTFNGMQWDGNVTMRNGTIQINGGNVQGSGTIQVGLLPDVPTTNTLKSRLNFTGAAIANTVSITDGFTLTLESTIGSSIRLTGTILGGSSTTITNAGNGTATITGTVPSTFAGTFLVTGTAGGMSLSPQAMAGAATVTNNNSLTIANVVPGATTSTLITGTGSVLVSGSQKVTISGSNTYSGGTRVASDVGMTKQWDGTDGSLGSGTITASGAEGRISWDGPEATINFNTPVNTGNLATERLGFAGQGKTFVMTGTAPGSIAGSGLLRASSGATLDLTQQTASSNTNAGGIEIGNATVVASGDDNLGSGTIVCSGTASVFRAAASTTAISRPFAVGSVDGTPGITARFDTAGNDLSLSGAITDRLGTLGGGIAKAGAGRLTLSASSGYTGPTAVEAGTLALGTAGAIAASPLVRIESGATFDVLQQVGGYAVPAGQTLAGSGTVAGAVGVGTAATLSPGASPGTLTITGNATLTSGGNYNWQVYDAAGTAGSVTGWDLVTAAGVLSIASTTADRFNINLWSLSAVGPDVNGNALNFSSATSGTWRIASAAG
ncbi:MAG: beta strand repeat-containing protein, partial [Planctomycetaceae bacterium]